MKHSTIGWMALMLLSFPLISTGQKKYYRDDLVNMVVEIADSRTDGLKALGSGIIISDSTKYYLVTATHVVAPIKGECIVRFKVLGKDACINIPLSKFTRNKSPKWNNHFDGDVSHVEIFPHDEEFARRLKEFSFPRNQIYCELNSVSRDFDVTTIGFPVHDELGVYFTPMTFTSYFSSGLIKLKRSDTQAISTFQLLENPSVQGYSGGPSFVGVMRNGVSVGPKFTVLVGLVHGTVSDNTGGKIAAITPSIFICDSLK